MPSFSGGGVERNITNIANELSSSYNTEIVVSRSKGPLKDSLNNNIEIIDLCCGRTLLSPYRVISYIRSNQPDVMFSSVILPNIINAAVNEIFDTSTVCIPIVNSVYSERVSDSINSQYLKDKILHGLVKKTFNQPNAIIAVSSYVKEDLINEYRLTETKVNVVPSPVVTSRLRKKSKAKTNHQWLESDEYKVILGAGRFIPLKNFDDLIKSFYYLKDHDRYRLVLLGDGPERGKLKKLVAELDISESVDFLGWENNPYPYMAESDLFMLTSSYEGFGNVIVEAMACGTPVVATNCPGGPAEIINDAPHCTTVQVGDTCSLAQCSKELLHKSIEPQDLTTYANKYSSTKIAKEYVSLIDEYTH